MFGATRCPRAASATASLAFDFDVHRSTASGLPAVESSTGRLQGRQQRRIGGLDLLAAPTRPPDPPASSSAGPRTSATPLRIVRGARPVSRARRVMPPHAQRQGPFGGAQPGLALVQRAEEAQERRFVELGGGAGIPPSIAYPRSGILLLPES